MTSEGVDFHSVGNTLELQQTALIEALNLKAAIEYQLKNSEAGSVSYWPGWGGEGVSCVGSIPPA